MEESFAAEVGADARFVLFATPLAIGSDGAMRTAVTVARTLGAELVILRVRPAPPMVTNDAGSGHVGGRVRFDYLLSERSKERWILTRCGEFRTVVAETARALRALLTVVPEVFAPMATWLGELALECEAPVLVAREFSASGSILAATNLEHPAFPVLRAGAFLSTSLRAPAVFVHNVDTAAPKEPLSRRADSVTVVGCLDTLVRAAESLGVESQNVVTLRPTADEGVLSLLRTERPDIVVLGARKRAARGVPGVERIIDEITSSVLIVPVDVTAFGDDEHVRNDTTSPGDHRVG